MSVTVQTWVWQNSDSNGNDRIVLLAIADEADDDGGNAYPSMERLATKCRVNRATVMRSVRRLEEQGELLVLRPDEYGRGKFNVYCVLMGRPAETLTVCHPSNQRQKSVKTTERSARKGAEGRAQVRPDPKTLRPIDSSSAKLSKLPRSVESDGVVKKGKKGKKSLAQLAAHLHAATAAQTRLRTIGAPANHAMWVSAVAANWLTDNAEHIAALLPNAHPDELPAVFLAKVETAATGGILTPPIVYECAECGSCGWHEHPTGGVVRCPNLGDRAAS